MKNYIVIVLVAILLTAPTKLIHAQITKGGTPRSLQKLFSTNNISTIQLPLVDVEKLVEEDKERRAMGKEFDRRFGFTFDVAYNLQNSGTWISLPNGDRIWQLRIVSHEATSINLTFSKYVLREGADLFIIGSKNKIGALTQLNIQTDQKLGTGLIRGDELLLEYFEPLALRGSGQIEIGKITHGYRDPFSIQGWGDSDDCEMNVNCPLGAPWNNEKRSVARYLDNGDICTGALVNNVLQDGKPYFLTANHCFSANSSTWVFSFNWESPTCTTPSTAIPENQTISGCTMKSRNGASDFCLFELSSKPPASFGVFYSGWSAADSPSQSSTIIHHPAGDIKKISFDIQAALHSGYGVNSVNDSSHWRIGNYEFSTTTEGGSSGSPMFDHNHRIVGQLHGGPASCTNISSDFYGKVSKSWNGGGTPATRLKDWLDPLSSGLLVLDGMDPGCKRIAINLPWKRNIDTVIKVLPYLWKVKNPNGDSTFHLSRGGFKTTSGKGIVLNAEIFNPGGRRDTLILAPVSVSKYKKFKVGFHHAYRRKSITQSDTLRLMVSRNCGQSFKTIQSWSGSNLVTDQTLNAISPFQPTDTTLWSSNEIGLDSTFNRAEQLVLAFGFSSGNAGTLWLDQFSLTGDSAKNKPLARFESDKTTGCAAVQIQFSDSTLYNPTSWQWSFTGGTPATSNLKNPLVTYSSAGNFPVKLIVTNEEGSDTIQKDGYITIQSMGQTNTPFLQTFTGIGTFPPSGYLLQNPNANVTWVVNGNVNAPGSTGGSLMFDNFSNPNVTGEKDVIILPSISTAGKQHLKLRFRYAYKYFPVTGGASPDTIKIGYSGSCGSTFNTVWKKGGLTLATAGSSTGPYTPSAADWKMLSLDLDSLLIHPEVAISFQNLSGYGNRIFIDDIYIDTIITCPVAPIIQSNSDTFCVGSTLILQMDSIANGIYSWTGPVGFNSTNRITSRVMALNSAGTYVASVTVNGCSSPVSNTTVTVLTNPTLPVFSVAGNILTAPNGYPNYAWIFNGDTLNANTRIITAAESGVYIVVVYNASGCFRASNPKAVIVTSVAGSITKSGIQISPNPASNSIQIITSNNQTEYMGIFNNLGQTVEINEQKVSPGVYNLDIHNLPSGNYWIRCKSGTKTIILPIIKN